VIGLLNGFFGAAATLVEERGGIVAKHVGGALIAAFNAPLPVKDHAARGRSRARPCSLHLSNERFSQDLSCTGKTASLRGCFCL
jgi:adenylate cyclase